MSDPISKPRLLIVEDDEITAELISLTALNHGFLPQICQSATAAYAIEWDKLSAALLDLELPDGDGFDLLCHARKRFPALPCFVITSRDSAGAAVAALKAGAIDYFTKPFDPEVVFPGVRQALDMPEPVVRKKAPNSGDWKSVAMIEADRAAIEAALSTFPLLLTGESGTGKRLFALTVHSRSRLAKNPFVSLDTSGLDPAALEIELFGGDIRGNGGKFTIKRGKLEMCQGGTLFIENIDQLPPFLQNRLLEALETRSERGATHLSSFRLISSTNIDLAAKASDGTFRQDLFYRIKATTIRLPAMREIIEDIPTWSNRILTEICVARKFCRPQLTKGALETLTDHSWPGNLDELHGVLCQAVTRCNGSLIGKEDLPQELFTSASTSAPAPALVHSRIDELERASLIAALEACGGNRRRAASRLGVSLRTIYNMIDRYALRPAPGSKD